MNAVAERVGVSAQSMLRWVRAHAQAHCPKPAPSGRTAAVEIDEMWHFVKKGPRSSGSKRPTSDERAAFIRPADRLGLGAALPSGARDRATLDRLLARLEPWGVRLFCTDDDAPYDAALPVGRHYIGKDEMQRSESNT